MANQLIDPTDYISNITHFTVLSYSGIFSVYFKSKDTKFQRLAKYFLLNTVVIRGYTGKRINLNRLA